MVTRNLLMLGAAAVVLAGCKVPIQDKAAHKPGPFQQQSAAAPIQAPPVSAKPAAPAPCACADGRVAAGHDTPASVSSPTAIPSITSGVTTGRRSSHQASHARRTPHGAPGAGRRAYRDHAQGLAGGPPTSAYGRHAARDDRYGGERAHTYAQTDGRYVSGDSVYSERSVEQRTYESEQVSSEGYRSAESYGYAQGSGYVGGADFIPGPTPAYTGGYTVGRSARGDAARSRAWARVRCPDR